MSSSGRQAIAKGHSFVSSRTMAGEEQDERQPLLGHRPQGVKRRIATVRSRSTAMALLLLMIFLVSYADQLQESPRTRILESIICYRHYEKTDPSKIKLGRDVVGPGAIGGVDEMYCKANAVADELAMLDGYLTMFSFIPGLVLAVPIGWLADRYGRWPVIFLNLVQFLLYTAWIQLVAWFWQAFDIRMIWFSAAFSILGGGGAVITSMLYVVSSDIASEAERAAAFLRIGAVNISANLFMPPLAAALMTFNPWIPSLMGTGLFAIAILAWLPMPETLHYPPASAASTTHFSEQDPLIDADIAPPDLAAAGNNGPAPVYFLHRVVLEFNDSTAFLLTDWRVPALISTFAIHMLVGTSGPLLLQYVSKRYALRMSEATLLVTIRQGVNTLLLFVILPWISDLLVKRYKLDSRKKDLYLARTSQALFAAGWALVAASPNWPTLVVSLVVASCGQGAATLTRSFLTSLLPKKHIASVYSLISVLDNLGAMAGSPLLASLFTTGVALGGAGIGMPFYFVAVVSALFALLLFAINLRKGEAESAADADEEQILEE